MILITQLSNRRLLTGFLFVVLGLNLSWNLKGQNSADFASSSLDCSTTALQTAIQNAVNSASSGQGFIVECTSGTMNEMRRSGRDRDKGRDTETKTFTRRIEVRATKTSDPANPAQTEALARTEGAPAAAPHGPSQYQLTFTAKVATEGGTCELCNQVVSREYNEVLEIPNNASTAKISEYARSSSLKSSIEDLFRSGQNDLKTQAEKILAELRDKEDEEDAQEEFDEAIKRCEIEPGTSIADFIEYQKGDMDSDDAEDIELASTDKLKCMQNRLRSMRSDEKNDYFYNELMPQLQEMLMGSSKEQQGARTILGSLQGDLRRKVGFGRGLNTSQMAQAQEVLQMSLYGNEIYRKISLYADEIKKNPNSPQAEQKIQEFKQMMSTSFDLGSRNAQLGSQAGAMATSWRDKLYGAMGLTPFTQGNSDGLASLDTRALDARLNPTSSNARVLADTQLTQDIASMKVETAALQELFQTGAAWSGQTSLVRQNAAAPLGVYDPTSNPNQVFPASNFTGQPNVQNPTMNPTALGSPSNVPPQVGQRVGRG